MKVNRALKEQLDTTLHSDGGSCSGNEGGSHSQQWSEHSSSDEPGAEEIGKERGRGSDEDTSDDVEEHSRLHQGLHEGRGLMMSPEASLTLDLIESGREHKAKYFPPKKSPQ